MSTKKLPKQKVTFALLAPEAQQVALLGDFGEWEQHPVSMKRLKDGRWQATLALAEGKYEYRYLVDGQWRNDPDCPVRAPNAFGSENCIRIVS
jgi:1,4-alpha-glucan branching enzyme